MVVMKKGLKNLTSITQVILSSSAKDLLKRGKSFADEATKFSSKTFSNKKKEIKILVEERKHSFNMFSQQLTNRKCRVQESIGNYIEDKSQSAKTACSTISSRVENYLSIGNNVFNDLAESYERASKIVGRKIDEHIYDSLKELRLKTAPLIITTNDIMDKSQFTISSGFKRIDDKGYLNLTKDEILYIISFCLSKKIEGMRTIVSILKWLLSIHIESYKDDLKLKTYARLAAYAYGRKTNLILPRGWEVINRIPDIRFEDKDTGLISVLFRKKASSEYVYGFAGTQNMKDWEENAKQVVGLSKQYNMALENAKIIKEYISPCHLTFTGHSQGGGEAALCAYHLGEEAITFNPAGMSPITKVKARSRHSKYSEINSYIYLSDVLNIAQQLTEIILYPLTADGEVHYIYDNIPRNFKIKEWHGMEGFLNYFDVDNNYR